MLRVLARGAGGGYITISSAPVRYSEVMEGDVWVEVVFVRLRWRVTKSSMVTARAGRIRIRQVRRRSVLTLLAEVNWCLTGATAAVHGSLEPLHESDRGRSYVDGFSETSATTTV